ncbi:MAG: pyridoxal phosphate-dependent aminotransferase [Nanoarchaeota archaeon]|nr:pyridoxal phosphate-dependent aminotransferase [Nanoarchaeota archaeon]MBU1270189.1 pyridoxal phosphate-dependent aminotransferase [Nanoarchaeota archaeon]MBU1604441.1 pyridoxal phosphate-dependent aminotransferase [Nanoarchaeota archaeon]MBU2443561.1 pyridoxal phosphate-dependent aminotransferase [Nanoarchaeota archaeon]
MNRFSKNVDSITQSATLAINSQAKNIQNKGSRVLSFAAGEPKFSLFDNVKAAGIQAIKDNFAQYTPVSGIPELKKAICNKFKTENKILYSEDEIMVSNGGKQVLFNILFSLLNKNETVIIPKPYWVSYIEQVKLSGGTSVLAETDNFQIKADLIEDKINSKTKVIILNSPSNPTGSVIKKKELNKIADVVVENDLFIISDEVYEHFVYDNCKHYSIASLNSEIKEKTITVNAASKTYAMTGLRVGYSAAPIEITNLMNNLQSHTTSGVCSIAQKMALSALTESQDLVRLNRDIFQKQRNYMVKTLNKIGLPCVKPEGAFYAFPSIQKSKLKSLEFCKKLLEEQRVAVVPGVAFGSDNHIRLSFGEKTEDMKEGLDRMEKFMRCLT